MEKNRFINKFQKPRYQSLCYVYPSSKISVSISETNKIKYYILLEGKAIKRRHSSIDKDFVIFCHDEHGELSTKKTKY